jgi:hypothetical protein
MVALPHCASHQAVSWLQRIESGGRASPSGSSNNLVAKDDGTQFSKLLGDKLNGLPT